MLRSVLRQLTASPQSVPLGGCRGFVLQPGGGAGHTWPVTVELETDRGERLTLLVRPGWFYGLGRPGTLAGATAKLPAGSAAALYQLDLADHPRDLIIPGPVA